MCGSMVDIQSPTAEIRRGIKEERRNHVKNITPASAMQCGHKQQCLPHMSLQYGELRPTNGWNLLASLGHPGKFKPVSRLGLATASTSLNGGQQNLQDVSPSPGLIHYIYIFGTEFFQLQNSLCVQVLRSPILPAILHGTRAADVSQTLWRDTRNGITELLQTAPPIFGWTAITLGIGPHSSWYNTAQR